MDSIGTHDGREEAHEAPSRSVQLLLVGSILLLAGLVQHAWSAQPSVRYLLTEAVVDHDTLTLDTHANLLDVDYARHDGHVYSDKAPYQPLLAVPAYQAFRWLGGEAFPRGSGRIDPNAFHWGRWWVSFSTSSVPGALLAVTMYRLVWRVRPAHAAAVAAALSIGTILLPLASDLFGHVLSALFIGVGWALARPSDASPWRLFAAGLLLSAAVGTEFPAAVVATAVGVAVLASRGWRRIGPLVAGGIVGSLPLLAYNWAAFGSPFETAYQGNLANFDQQGALGLYGVVWPQADEVWKAMFGDRGLLTLTPICALALGGAVLTIARRHADRRDGILALVVVMAMWLLSAGVDGYGGGSPGPRYMIPAIPFLGIPLSEMWDRLPRLCSVVAILSAVPMVLATMTAPLVATDFDRSLRYWVDRAAGGHLARNLPAEVFGVGWALPALMALGLALAFGAALRPGPASTSPVTSTQAPPATGAGRDR